MLTEILRGNYLALWLKTCIFHLLQNKYIFFLITPSCYSLLVGRSYLKSKSNLKILSSSNLFHGKI